MEYTLVIDQGTHATRAILFDHHGHILEQQQQDVQLICLSDERIQQDAGEILQSVHDVLQRLDKNRLKQTTRCAITTQRSTVVAWHRTSGQALYPALSWQDRRCHETLKKLMPHQSTIRGITGLPLSAHYGASKMHWLLQHVDTVKQAQQKHQLLIAPLASFLLNNLLTNRPYLVDHSNAHRTLLFDIHTLDWSDEISRLFHLPRDLLPACKPLIYSYGQLAGSGIPVTAVCGDQTAALYAHGNIESDAALINIGTGAFILSPTTRPQTCNQLLCSIGKSSGTQVSYLLEGTVNGAGAALSWAQQQFPVSQLYEKLDTWLQQQVSNIPIFINSVGGLGSPWWKSNVIPYFLHLQNTDSQLIYIAVVESIVFLLANNIQAMQEIHSLKKLYVSGGLSQLDGLCQKLADISQLPVHRLSQTEATASGAAWLANNCPSDWPEPRLNNIFMPGTQSALIHRYNEFTSEINSL